MRDAIKFEIEHWAGNLRDAARDLDVEASREKPSFDRLCTYSDHVERALGKVNDYLEQHQNEEDGEAQAPEAAS